MALSPDQSRYRKFSASFRLPRLSGTCLDPVSPIEALVSAHALCFSRDEPSTLATNNFHLFNEFPPEAILQVSKKL